VLVEHAQARPMRRQVMRHPVRRLLTAVAAVQLAVAGAAVVDTPAVAAEVMPVAEGNN